MGKRKYPLWPAPKDEEVPYDAEHFKRWLVNSQGVKISTATSYVSSIRTAFSVLFDDEDPLFNNLRDAFRNRFDEPNKYFSRLENEYEALEGYVWAVKEFGDVMLDEFNYSLKPGESKSAPKDMWVTAFQAYLRYTRWRIDLHKEIDGIPVTIENNNNLFIDMPLACQYRSYLKCLGAGYASKSIDLYYSKLKRLYNLLFRNKLKKDIIQYFESYIERGVDISDVCCKLKSIIDNEIENPKIENLSSEDLDRGKHAFDLYCDFLKDYANNPGKYPKEEYEIPLPD